MKTILIKAPIAYKSNEDYEDNPSPYSVSLSYQIKYFLNDS
jgi:hypothetical protein